MDYTKTVTHLEFAAGYAGIGLGLRRAIRNLRPIAYVEINAFPISNLVAKMEAELLPAAPVWPDIKTFPSKQFHGIVDILSAGYPCQPFSLAGQRKGKEDPRHLWPYIRSAAELIRPGICFFENVEGHITSGLDTVLSDMGELGYEVEAGIFSAEEVGAPHQRKRVFILGIREGYSLANPFCMWKPQPQGSKPDIRRWSIHPGQEVWPTRPKQRQAPWEPPRTVGDTESTKSQGPGSTRTGRSGSSNTNNVGYSSQSSQRTEQKIPKWKKPNPYRICEGSGGYVESPMGRDADGHSDRLDYAKLHRSGDNRTDELRLCGNGVIPATVEKAFIVLYDKLTN